MYVLPLRILAVSLLIALIFTRDLAAQQTAPQVVESVRQILGRGEEAFRAGRYDEAEAFLQQALTRFGQTPEVESVLWTLSYFYRQTRQYGQGFAALTALERYYGADITVDEARDLYYRKAALFALNYNRRLTEIGLASSAASLREMAQERRPLSVELRIDNGSHRFVQGQAVVLSRHRILTAHHLLKGANAVEVVVGKMTFPVTHVVATDSASDWAVLQVLELPLDLRDGAMGKFAKQRPSRRTPLVGVPYQGVADELAVGEIFGEVVGTTDRGANEQPFIVANMPVFKGMSGAPVWTLHGDLVGVVSIATTRDLQQRSLSSVPFALISGLPPQDVADPKKTPARVTWKSGLWRDGATMLDNDPVEEAMAATQRGKMIRSIEILQPYCEKAPGDATAHYLLASSYERVHRYDLALATFKKLAAIDWDPYRAKLGAWWVRLRQSAVEARLDNQGVLSTLEGLIEEGKAIVDEAPDNSYLVHTVVVALLQHGRLAEALDLMNRFLEHDPFNLSVLEMAYGAATAMHHPTTELFAERLRRFLPFDPSYRIQSRKENK